MTVKTNHEQVGPCLPVVANQHLLVTQSFEMVVLDLLFFVESLELGYWMIRLSQLKSEQVGPCLPVVVGHFPLHLINQRSTFAFLHQEAVFDEGLLVRFPVLAVPTTVDAAV